MRNHLRLSALTLAISFTISIQAYAQGGRLRVIIAGTELPSQRVRSVVVDSDTTGVDGATVVIGGVRTPTVSLGDSVSVESTGGGSSGGTIFKGEVTSIEPNYQTASPIVIVRSFNRLHRLTRQTKTRTFDKQSDADIAAAIAHEANLDFGPTGPEATFKHEMVFQYNQTDLDFLRVRANRIGYTVEVEDQTLYFRRPSDPLPVSLACAPNQNGFTPELRVFHPRLSGTSVVKKVTVRGWDPARKEVVAEATRPMIPLSPKAAGIVEPPGPTFDVDVVQPLETVQSAYGAANGTLLALTALDLSAEADTSGSASLHAGAKVVIQKAGSPFDGKYVITAASHRFERDSGWHTQIRLTREDRAVFLLPEIGDEVLVAFEHGDIHRPYVVGSLWDSSAPVAEAPFCGPAAGRE